MTLLLRWKENLIILDNWFCYDYLISPSPQVYTITMAVSAHIMFGSSASEIKHTQKYNLKYAIPRQNLSTAAQGVHRWGQRWPLPCAWEAREILSEAGDLWSNMKTPFLMPHLQDGLLEALIWCWFQLWLWEQRQPQTTVPELPGVDFCPLNLLGDGAGQTGCNSVWPELCSLLAIVEGVCWMGTMSSKQLGYSCQNANSSPQLWYWATETLRSPKRRKKCHSWQPHTHTCTHTPPILSARGKTCSGIIQQLCLKAEYLKPNRSNSRS